MENVIVKANALGELVKSLHAVAERENVLFDQLRTAHAAEDSDKVYRLTGELLSLRAEGGVGKPKNCTDQSI